MEEQKEIGRNFNFIFRASYLFEVCIADRRPGNEIGRSYKRNTLMKVIILRDPKKIKSECNYNKQQKLTFSMFTHTLLKVNICQYLL